MKRVWLVLALTLAILSACGPAKPTQESKDSAAVEDQQALYARNQPIPRFEFSQDRDTLIQIYQLKNEARQTWSVIQSITGQPVWSCPSRGYPLPADTQLTNGMQLQGRYLNDTSNSWHYITGTVEQPEPNGLFSSKNTDATFILCIRPNGDTVPIYSEQKVTTFPFAVEVKDGQIVDLGKESMATVQLGKR